MASIPLSPAATRAAPRILQLAADLEREGKLAEVGGVAYLIECVDAAEAARQPGESIEEVAIRAANQVAARRKRTSTGARQARSARRRVDDTSGPVGGFNAGHDERDSGEP